MEVNTKETLILIFSRDRAMQLDATLRSYMLHCSDFDEYDIRILYTTSSEHHQRQYDILASEFSKNRDIKFIKEKSFKSDVLALAAPYEKLLFLVDDNIFVRDFRIVDLVNLLDENQKAIGISLRLGKNTDYCYSRRASQRFPKFTQIGYGYIIFDWTNEEYDFGYPLELSSSIYRVADIFKLMVVIDFRNPNTLEEYLWQNVSYYKEPLPELICYEESLTFCIPVNKVQTTNPTNRASEQISYSADELADIFDKGKRIDIEKYNNFIPNACHQEVELVFTGDAIKQSDIIVSVIIPCYKQAEYLAEAVESVVNQTYKIWECIIVNDGSPDNTNEIANQLIKKYHDCNIQVIELQNGGLPFARNEGIKISKGKYILPLDADDKIATTYLEETVAILEKNPGYDIVYVDEQNFGETNHIHRKGPSGLQYLIKYNVHDYCSLFRKEVWETGGGFSTAMFIGAHDWNFWVSAAKHGFKSYHLEKPLFLYRNRAGTMVETTMSKIDEVLAHIIIHHKELYDDKAIADAKEKIRKMPASSSDRLINALKRHPTNPLLHELYMIWRPEEIESIKVTVIIPTFNRPEMLKIAVLSVLQQTYKDFEIIVINDGGESVIKVIEGFDDQRIKYLELWKNSGMSIVRNTGIKCSRGKYICYLDDDDIFYNNHLETLVRFLENSNYKVAYTDAFRASQVKQNGEYVTVDRKVIYSEDFSYKKLLVGNYIPILCVMHNRLCLEYSGLYDESLSTHEDWDLWIRIGLNFEFAHIRQATCEFTWRTDGSTMTSSRRADMLRTLRIIYDKTKGIVGENEEILYHRRINEKSIEAEVNKLKETEKTGVKIQSIKRDKPSVSIIIPVFNRIELTKKCINSIYQFTQNIKFEIIAIDNASSDGTQSLFRELSTERDNFIFIRNSKNEGFAAACNQGISKSKSEFIILLNNDTEVTGGWLEPLIKEAMSDEKIGIVGSLLLYPDTDKIQHCGVRAGMIGGGIAPYHVNRLRSLNSTPSARNSRDYKVVTFACVLLKKYVISEIGLLDEKFKNGYEDVDYCFRAYSTGYRIRYCADSIVYHYESMSISRHDNDKINQKLLDEKWLNVIELDENEEITISNQWEIWIREILEKNPDDIKYIHRLIQVLQKNGDYREAEDLKKKMIGLLNKQEKNDPAVTFVIPFTFDLDLLSEFINSIRRTVTGFNYNFTIAGNIPKDIVDTHLPKKLSKKDDVFLLNDPLINSNIISLSQGIISNNSCFICFVEPSLHLSEKWFDNLINVIRSDENIGLAGPCILDSNSEYIKPGWGQIKPQPTGIDLYYPVNGKSISELKESEISNDVHSLPLTCMLIRKSAVVNVGVPDEGFEKYFADVDFCLRMSQSGFKVRFCGSSIVSDSGSQNYDIDLKQTKDYHRFRSKWTGQITIDETCKIEFIKKILPIRIDEDKFHHKIDSHITFSIIIPVHNNLDYTKRCIEGIRKMKGLFNIELILIDNASTDGTAEYLKNLNEETKGNKSLQFEIISNHNNENYAFVNNRGAEIAKGKYLVFLNNDTYPFPGWLDAIEKEFRSNPDVGIQGAKLLYENGTIQHAGMIFGERPGRPEEPYHAYLTADPSLPLVDRRREMQFVTGACLAIRTELFRQIGGFDEKYVFGWEDTDLCMKVNSSGKKIIYNPEVVLYHYESITKKLRQSNGEDLLALDTPKELRNRERFMKRWDSQIKRDANLFYAEDGLKMQGNTLVPVNEEKFKSMMESQIKGAKQKEEKKEYFTSFSKKFLDRNYQYAKTVIIKSPPAIGDAFALTAIVAELKEKYPQLKIYISGNEIVGDVFLNHNDIEDIILSGSEDEITIESMADVVVDYTNIIAKLPEYYNGISYMDIFGNIAGMRFTKQDIIYTITEQEADWAKNEISNFKNGYELIGIQLFTNKDQKRSYPYTKDLVRELLNRNPNFRFLLLGKESPGLSIPELYDCAWKNIPFRLQMALAEHCDKFLTIDSAFYHAGHNYFKKPTMVLFGLTNPALSGNPSSGFAVARNQNLNCLNCYWRIPCNIECMNNFSPSVIADEFLDIENNIKKNFDYKEVTINVTENTDIDNVLFGFYLNNKETVKLKLIDEKNVLPGYFANANGITLESHGNVSQQEILPKENADENLSGFTFDLEEEEKPVFDTEHKLETHGNTPLHEGKNGQPQLNIVWEGSQFVYHSLALINREQCANLIDTGLANVTIVPYENDRFLPGGNPKYEKLKDNDIRFKKEVSKEVARLPYVWIRHQWPPNNEPPRGAKWIIMQPWEYTTLRKDFADLFKQADELWTPSTYSRQSFINSGIDFNKVQVIPNGIDPELFKPSGDKYLIPTNKKLKFLYIGGTIFRKGIDVLLHAYTKAFTSDDDITLIIKDMGGESFYKGQTAKDHIEKLRKVPGSPEIIYFDNYMTEEQIANLYRSCDVFVCSYRGEGFSLPTLEAMACGLPVIVTDGGSTDDFVDEKVGWLIPSEPRSIGDKIGNLELTGEAFVLEPDAAALTEILKNVYSNPALIFDKGLKATYRARTQWTWKRSTLKIISRLDYLYDKALAHKAENNLNDKRDEFIILGEADENFDSGNYESAKRLYSEVLEHGIKSDRFKLHALHKLSMISMLESDFELAGKFISEADIISPDHPDSIYIKAKSFLMNGNWTEALELLTELMNKWKETRFNTTLKVALDDLLCDTAEGLFELGDIENSLKLYTEALKMNNSNPFACFGAARCFIEAGINDDAIKMLEWAIKLKPDFAEAEKLMNNL